MTFEEFVMQSKAAYEKSGATHMTSFLGNLIDNGATSFDGVCDDVLGKRDVCELFGNEFMFWWSILTFVEDLDARWRTLNGLEVRPRLVVTPDKLQHEPKMIYFSTPK